MSNQQIEAMKANSEILNEDNPRNVRRSTIVESYKTLLPRYRAALYKKVNGEWMLTDEDREEAKQYTLKTISKRFHTTPEHVVAVLKKLNS